MDWLEPLFDWADSNKALLWWLFAASVALVLLTPIALAWAVIGLPADYFTEKHRRPLSSWVAHPLLRAALLVAKNLLGLLLLIAGLVMLVVPGQGLLSIAVAMILLDFPGKFRFERWLAIRPPVWRSLNWVRKRARCEPLKKPA